MKRGKPPLPESDENLTPSICMYLNASFISEHFIVIFISRRIVKRLIENLTNSTFLVSCRGNSYCLMIFSIGSPTSLFTSLRLLRWAGADLRGTVPGRGQPMGRGLCSPAIDTRPSPCPGIQSPVIPRMSSIPFIYLAQILCLSFIMRRVLVPTAPRSPRDLCGDVCGRQG